LGVAFGLFMAGVRVHPLLHSASFLKVVLS
jgi:hypothetical protein